MSINPINSGAVPFRLDPTILTPGQEVALKTARKFLAVTAGCATVAVASGILFSATPLFAVSTVAISTLGFVKFAITTAGKYKDFNRNSQKRIDAIKSLNTEFSFEKLDSAFRDIHITHEEMLLFFRNHLETADIKTIVSRETDAFFVICLILYSPNLREDYEQNHNPFESKLIAYFNDPASIDSDECVDGYIYSYIVDPKTQNQNLKKAYVSFIRNLLIAAQNNQIDYPKICKKLCDIPRKIIDKVISDPLERKAAQETLDIAFLALSPGERWKYLRGNDPGHFFILQTIDKVLSPAFRSDFFNQVPELSERGLFSVRYDVVEWLKANSERGYAQLCRENIEFFELNVLSRNTKINETTLGALMDKEIVEMLRQDRLDDTFPAILLTDVTKKIRANIEPKRKELEKQIEEFDRVLNAKKVELKIEELEKQIAEDTENLKFRSKKEKDAIQKRLDANKPLLGNNNRILKQVQKDIAAKKAATIEAFEEYKKVQFAC